MRKVFKDIDRFKKAESKKVNWREYYKECLEYVNPHRENFDEEADYSPGQRKGEYVFDSTAIDAGSKFVSNLQSSLVPPMREWIGLKAGTSTKGDKGVEEALAEITKIMFSSLRNSNFDTQVSESFADLLIGTGALLVQKGTEEVPFRFINVPLSQLFLEEGVDGRPDSAWREWKLPARNIEKTWEDAKPGKDLAELSTRRD